MGCWGSGSVPDPRGDNSMGRSESAERGFWGSAHDRQVLGTGAPVRFLTKGETIAGEEKRAGTAGVPLRSRERGREMGTAGIPLRTRGQVGKK